MDLTILNERQREAVEQLEGPLLVLAGAGSGKTRVLTYRIANLMEHGVSGRNILALTFTNKAAGEMRDRTAALVGSEALDMWVCTFHSCCVRILRYDFDKLGGDKRFNIYDDDDTMKLIGECIKSLGISDKELPKRQVREIISSAKNRSMDAESYIAENSKDEVFLKLYRLYQRRLKECSALDFDDLLVETYKLFSNCPDVLEKYRRRFKYVLVDEYQDTNMLQYSIVELLCRERRNLCVVGDDDQSIYGWRGADVQNILGFERDFPGAKVVRLEQNYRSTMPILSAANDVISHNQSRKEKKLWTDREGGEPVELMTVPTERDEARFLCQRIAEGVKNGRRYSDYAVLYRMNAQSRVIENTLLNYGIPHKVYGGFRFYERKEIKDILAYLRLLYNPADDVAFERVINVPKRGIGDASVQELKNVAQDMSAPLLVAAMSPEKLTQRTAKRITPFTEAMIKFNGYRADMKPSELAERMVEELRYEEYIKTDEKDGDWETRMDNVRELVGNIREIESTVGADEDPLAAFLENVSLISDIDAMQGEQSTVSLMTLHSAKGLEFPVVFMVGMEENIFPTSRAVRSFETSAMEEERRLCYVGMTRAREQLYLVNTKTRMLFGDWSSNRCSRFVGEIAPLNLKREGPPERVRDDAAEKRIAEEHERVVKAYASHYQTAKPLPVTPPEVCGSYSAGERVSHSKFGSGVITAVTGSGLAMMVTVMFDSIGEKRLAASYAPLKKI